MAWRRKASCTKALQPSVDEKTQAGALRARIRVHGKRQFGLAGSRAPGASSNASSAISVKPRSASSAAITPLADTYRVIRPDLPGFGQSRVPADLDYDWGPVGLAADVRRLVEALGIRRFHLAGAKYGGSVAIEYAAGNSQHIKSLTVIGGPVQVENQQSQVDVKGISARIAAGGMLRWAEDSMDARLGSKVPAAQRRWWVEMMASADARATCESADAAARLDLLGRLKEVSAPVLLITTRGNRLLPLANFERWTAAVPGAKLLVLDGDAYHPAALHAAEFVAALKAHIRAA